MEKDIKNYKCSCCGKFFTKNNPMRFNFNTYIGYGSFFDETHIEFKLCSMCRDKFLKTLQPEMPFMKMYKVEQADNGKTKEKELSYDEIKEIFA